MSTPEEPSEHSAEMTPEAREIIGKARRSFGFSISILLVGFIAVAFALVYRAMRDDGVETGFAELVLPVGAIVRSVAPDGSRFAVTYELGGEVKVRLVDGLSGETLREFSIVNE